MPSQVKLRNNQTEHSEYLHVDATIKAICSDKAIFTFPKVGGGSCQSSEMAAMLDSLSFLFKKLFLLKHNDYNIVKWCSGI